MPALHRNTIAFIGMNKRDTYIAAITIKDKFIVLDNNNQLMCWSVLTGKLLGSNKLSFIQDYSNFSVFSTQKDIFDTEYKREWYSKVLLMKNQAEKNLD